MPHALPLSLDRWIRDPSHPQVDASWVPGLDEAERRALGAVGGLAAALLNSHQIDSLPIQVRTWMTGAPTPESCDIAAFGELLSRDPDVALARLYSTVVRREHRRQLGTFFTPSAEVKLMLDLWSETEGTEPDTVIDVGAGVGVFTAEAAKKWPNARIVAVDINPVTLGLLAVRLLAETATDRAEEFSSRVELVCEDYTRWFASDDAPAPGGRLILGNPPYTRAQLLTTEERGRLHELTDGLCGTRASLSTIITAMTLQRLGPSDGLSLLLPAQWLESQYASNLRNRMWNEHRRRVELRLIESEDLFGGAQVDAVALLIGAENLSARPFRVAKWRGAPLLELDRSQPCPHEWRGAFDPKTAPAEDLASTSVLTLSEFAKVNRGVATGSNATFVLTTSEVGGLPTDALTRVITRLADLPDQLDLEGLRAASERSVKWLLVLTQDLIEKHEVLASLVKQAEIAEIDKRVLCSRRRTWFDLTEEVLRPDVVIGAMTQGRFKLVSNAGNATITNNLYGITWKDTASAEQRHMILSWLRSDEGQTALTAVARRQGAGLLKLEPGGLRSLAIPPYVMVPKEVPTELPVRARSSED